MSDSCLTLHVVSPCGNTESVASSHWPADRGTHQFATWSMHGCQAWLQTHSDWPQIGRIWVFLRSVSIHFGSPRKNILRSDLKSPEFLPFGAILTQFGAKPNIHGSVPPLVPGVSEADYASNWDSSQNEQATDPKKFQICHIWGQSDQPGLDIQPHRWFCLVYADRLTGRLNTRTWHSRWWQSWWLRQMRDASHCNYCTQSRLYTLSTI